MAADLAIHRVDLIVSCSYPAAVAALNEAPRVPVVAIHAGDPVETGMAQGVSHPGGRVTGVSQVSTNLSAKRLQLLKEAVPTMRKVALIWNEGDLAMQMRREAVQSGAKKLVLEAQVVPIRTSDSFKKALDSISEDPPDAAFVVADGLTILNPERVFRYAAAHRLPDTEEYRFLSHPGGRSLRTDPRGNLARCASAGRRGCVRRDPRLLARAADDWADQVARARGSSHRIPD
jgi:putative tryptophan/tyrosine transport system substrate-binding protein